MICDLDFSFVCCQNSLFKHLMTVTMSLRILYLTSRLAINFMTSLPSQYSRCVIGETWWGCGCRVRSMWRCHDPLYWPTVYSTWHIWGCPCFLGDIVAAGVWRCLFRKAFVLWQQENTKTPTHERTTTTWADKQRWLWTLDLQSLRQAKQPQSTFALRFHAQRQSQDNQQPRATNCPRVPPKTGNFLRKVLYGKDIRGTCGASTKGAKLSAGQR